MIEVTKVEKVECQGEKISSTCIRERLVKGLVEEIPHFLGRPYEVKGNWDGSSIQIESYYTLPAPRSYMVTVKKGSLSICNRIGGDRGFGDTIAKLPFYMKGKYLDSLALSNE